MLYEFSLVTQHRPQCDNLGIGVLLAPVSCWCPRGRLAPLCYASLAGDGLLVATHRHRPPHHIQTEKSTKILPNTLLCFAPFAIVVAFWLL